MSKDTITKLAYAVLVFVLAVAAIFGYDIGVIQPREALQAGGGSRAAGVNVRTEKALIVENYITDQGTLAVTGDATVGGALAVTGAVTAASFTPQSLTTAGDIFANTGTFTTSTSAGALTATSATIGGGFGSTGCTLSSAGVLQCNGAATIGGAALITGTLVVQGAAEINANLDVDSLSAAGNLDITTINNTGANPVTINDDLTITGTMTLGGYAWVVSAPITITDVLTNVRVLYYQIP